MPLLNPAQLEKSLQDLSGWSHAEDDLVRQWTFASFLESLSFVNAVARVAEQAGHHPDIDIRYNRVTLSLSTHDAGGITEKDIALARTIDNLL